MKLIKLSMFFFLFIFPTLGYNQANVCEGDTCTSLKIIDHYKFNFESQIFPACNSGAIFCYERHKGMKRESDYLKVQVALFDSNLVLIKDTSISFPEKLYGIKVFSIVGANRTYLVFNLMQDIVKGKSKNSVFCYAVDKYGNFKASDKIEVLGMDMLTGFIDEKGLNILMGRDAIYETRYDGMSGYSLKSGKKSEVSVLRFNESDLTGKTINLEVPEEIDFSDKNHEYTFWDYVHTNEGLQYLMIKDIADPEKIKAYFYGFNENGVVSKEYSTDLNLPSNKFQRRSEVINDNSRGKFTMVNPVYVGYSNHYTDASNKCYYIYGLSGSHADKAVANEYESFFVMKYNFDGVLIWEKNYDVVKAFLEEKYFSVHGVPGSRSIALKKDVDGNLNVLINCTSGVKLNGAVERISSTYFLDEGSGEMKASGLYNNTIGYVNHKDNYTEFFSGTTNNATKFLLKIPEKERIYYYMTVLEYEKYQIAAYFKNTSANGTTYSNESELFLIKLDR